MLQPGGFQGIARAPVHVVAKHPCFGSRMPEELLEGLEGVTGALKGVEKVPVNFESKIHII
jgi:hypothetical protein